MIVIPAGPGIKNPMNHQNLVVMKNGTPIGRVLLLDTDRRLAYQLEEDGTVTCVEGVETIATASGSAHVKPVG